MGDENGGGMRGSEADPRPVREDRSFSTRKETRASHNVDEAQMTRAEAYALEQREAAARHGLDVTTKALGEALTRNERISGLLEKSQGTILDLSVKLAEASSKTGKGKKHKRKLEADVKVRLHEIDERHRSIRQACVSFAPIALPLAPKIKLLVDHYLPTVLAAAESGEVSPQAALIRLFVQLQNPDEESDGHQVYLGLQRVAGEQDWPLIQQALAEMAAQSPAAKGASHVHASVEVQ